MLLYWCTYCTSTGMTEERDWLSSPGQVLYQMINELQLDFQKINAATAVWKGPQKVLKPKKIFFKGIRFKTQIILLYSRGKICFTLDTVSATPILLNFTYLADVWIFERFISQLLTCVFVIKAPRWFCTSCLAGPISIMSKCSGSVEALLNTNTIKVSAGDQES